MILSSQYRGYPQYLLTSDSTKLQVRGFWNKCRYLAGGTKRAWYSRTKIQSLSVAVRGTLRSVIRVKLTQNGLPSCTDLRSVRCRKRRIALQVWLIIDGTWLVELIKIEANGGDFDKKPSVSPWQQLLVKFCKVWKAVELKDDVLLKVLIEVNFFLR